MTFNQFRLLMAMFLAFTLAACGGNPGADLGAFPALTKIEGDAPFSLTAPTSASPGAFSFTSSNPAVATISGKIVTIVAAGTSTITATQEAYGKWGSNSVTMTLTVVVKKNLVYGGRTWMPVSSLDTWAKANTFCTTSTISNLTGWRLPSDFELSELYKNVALNAEGWTLSETWSATGGTTSAHRKTVSLKDGAVSEQLETESRYFTCVR